MKRKTVQYAIAAAIVIGVIAFRHSRTPADGPAPSTTSSGRFAIPAGTSGFRLGSLDFTPCELEQKRSAATTAAYCAPFEVAENRQATDGRRIALKLALIKSTEAATDDFIVFLAGGPGQAAIDSWPQIASALEPARKRRNVLLLDQRGTGGSNALDCAQEDDAEALPDADLGKVRAQTQRCLDGVREHADPRFYTTTDAVADLEALRLALGGPQFDLVGVSYGTRVAQQYLKRHPDGVRSVVLDSPAPNELVLGAEFARNLDNALKAQFAQCTKDTACARAFTDPYASLLRLRDTLAREPRTLTYSDPVTFARSERRLDAFGLAGLVRLYAYSPETAALIPLSVQQALDGNFAPLMGQLKLLSDGLGELAGSGMQLSVICAEDADRLRADAADASTLLGTLLVDVVREQCAIWPRGERPADFNEPTRGDTPILVLSGELDPVTPPRYAEQIMQTIGNAKLIVAKGQGHNVIGRGCLPKLTAEFIDRLSPKTLDSACADRLGATPAFIDFNGASP